jgi:hypothetical protein
MNKMKRAPSHINEITLLKSPDPSTMWDWGEKANATAITCRTGDGDDTGRYGQNGHKRVNACNLKCECDMWGQMCEHVKRANAMVIACWTGDVDDNRQVQAKWSQTVMNKWVYATWSVSVTCKVECVSVWKGIRNHTQMSKEWMWMLVCEWVGVRVLVSASEDRWCGTFVIRAKWKCSMASTKGLGDVRNRQRR